MFESTYFSLKVLRPGAQVQQDYQYLCRVLKTYRFTAVLNSAYKYSSMFRHKIRKVIRISEKTRAFKQ